MSCSQNERGNRNWMYIGLGVLGLIGLIASAMSGVPVDLGSSGPLYECPRCDDRSAVENCDCEGGS